MSIHGVFCPQVSADYCDTEDLSMPAEAPPGGGGGVARASLICRPNSHPFQDRMLGLDQPVKVGRSVARARPLNTNAIFDCKVSGWVVVRYIYLLRRINFTNKTLNVDSSCTSCSS